MRVDVVSRTCVMCREGRGIRVRYMWVPFSSNQMPYRRLARFPILSLFLSWLVLSSRFFFSRICTCGRQCIAEPDDELSNSLSERKTVRQNSLAAGDSPSTLAWGGQSKCVYSVFMRCRDVHTKTRTWKMPVENFMPTVNPEPHVEIGHYCTIEWTAVRKNQQSCDL